MNESCVTSVLLLTLQSRDAGRNLTLVRKVVLLELLFQNQLVLVTDGAKDRKHTGIK